MFPTPSLVYRPLRNQSQARLVWQSLEAEWLQQVLPTACCVGVLLAFSLAMTPSLAGAAVAQVQLLPVDTMNNNDHYGYAVAISEDGNTAVVGAPNKEMDGLANVGAAYIFVRNGSQWQQQAKLNAVQMNYAREGFGYAVGISGDHVIVGTDNSKAAYVFVREGTTWTRQGMRFDVVTAWQSSGMYGSAVAISGDYAVVGDPEWETSTSSARGAVHFFQRVGEEWLTSANNVLVGSHSYERYGYSVATRGTRAVAGGPYESSGNQYPGGAWLYPGGVQLNQNPKVDSACFGNSVALSTDGGTAIVGAPYEGPLGGAVYVFGVGSSGFWEQQARLTIPSGTDYLGYSCSISSGIIAAGAHHENGIRGAVYLFTGSATSWSQQEAIYASVSRESDYFGYSVSISGGTVVIGAPAINQARSGMAYVYEASKPIVLSKVMKLPNGNLAFDFTGTPGGTHTVLTAASPDVPIGQWASLGSPVEPVPGQFHFEDPTSGGVSGRFYRVRSP